MPEEVTVGQLIIVFIFGGGLFTTIGLLWKISKRDFAIDTVIGSLDTVNVKIKSLENKINNEDEVIFSNFKNSETRIIDIEKELIEIKTNQKNLLYSIDSQNYQILDLIERLEKNHESFIKTQIKVNDKLELAINAIKDSLININSRDKKF
jgi:hypothetical protein